MNSHSLDEYLRTIYSLEAEEKAVRVTDIAKERECSKPSVNRAVKLLAEEGLIEYEAYGKIHLTPKGKKEAEKVQKTWVVLKAFLTKVLEVPEEKAKDEAESMKYAVSEETVGKLEEYIESIIEIEELDCCYNGKRKKCRECEKAKAIVQEKKKGKKKVVVGMSGGVDSSVSALLLKEQGYEVIGVTLNLTGNSEKEAQDAQKVCDCLQIPHYIFDARKEFEEKVVEPFVSCYQNGLTPNPCIECNHYLKFGKMFEIAKELGAEYIATGHYAKQEQDVKTGKVVLKKSDSKEKDQSYVLCQVPKEVLPHILFPLEKFTDKEEIRKIARDNNLPVAEKKDSQDICFIPDGDYASFLEKKTKKKAKKGEIVDETGKVLGEHKGLIHYTIGQRRGLGIANPVPLFVLGFDEEKNRLIVGEEEKLYQQELCVVDVNWLIDEPKEGEKIVANVKIRYHAKEAQATLTRKKDKVKVVFDEPQRGITPGQSAVFYQKDQVIGGGKIERKQK